MFQAEFVSVGKGRSSAIYRDVAISPDGHWMITAGKDGYLVLWKIDGRQIEMTYQVSTSSLAGLLGDLETPIEAPDGSLVHSGLENVEFSADGRTIYFSQKSGPIRILQLAEILRLANRTPGEKLDDYSESIGLKIESDGRARTIERNQMMQVFTE